MADAPRREEYAVLRPLTTRWHDNDIYGHVNNVVYYSYFDSAVNAYLIEQGGLDIHSGQIIGLVVHSNCDYHAAVAYPEALEAGLRVNRLGNSSVQYGVAIFRRGSDVACADGQFTHVFVDRQTNRPAAMPPKLRAALEAIRV